MTQISEIKHTTPTHFESDVQQMIYQMFDRLSIDFERITCDAAITMDDCRDISRALDVDIVKTLFLCNRQRTAFYLLAMKGDKPFVTRDFSRALGVSRVSFTSAEMMLDMLHTPVGGASVLSAVIDTNHTIRVVIDSELARDEWWGCNDGTPNSYLRLRTDDVLGRYLPATGHAPEIIEI